MRLVFLRGNESTAISRDARQKGDDEVRGENVASGLALEHEQGQSSQAVSPLCAVVRDGLQPLLTAYAFAFASFWSGLFDPRIVPWKILALAHADRRTANRMVNFDSRVIVLLSFIDV